MKQVRIEKFQGQMCEKMAARAIELGFDANKVAPIYDGVCNIQRYIESPIKVMWVLKEPYDYNGGDWNIYEDWLKHEEFDRVTKNRTWKVMMYVMYGICTGYKYDDMPWIWDEPKMPEFLSGCAYINLSKMPGGTSSGNMTAKFEQWKDIVLEQIDVYAPDVIICGNTMNALWNTEVCDYKNSPMVSSIEGKVDAYKNKNGQIIIDAYHPNQRKIVQQEYIDTIVSMVRTLGAK